MDLADNGAASAAPDAGTVDSATPSNAEVIKDNSWDSIDKTMDTAYDKVNPPREPTGQFKGDKPEGVAEGEDPDAKPEVTDQTQTKDAAEPLNAAVIDAPLSWSAEMKAKWSSLPPDVQAYAAQREGDAHKRISELGQQVKQFEPIRQHIEPLRQLSQRNGVSEGEGLQRLLAANEFLEKDAPAAIKWLADAYGVDLGATSNTSSDGGSAETTALKAEIASLKRQVGETHNTVMARVNAEKDQAQATLSKLVNDFAAGKDDFKDIEGDIAAHIAAIRNAEPDLEPKALLDKAYDAARWANPVTRAKMLESERKAEEAKRTEANKAKADAAKKAGNLNVKSGNGASPTKKTSWEDTLSAAADRVYGN